MSFLDRMDRKMISMTAMMEKVGVDIDRLALSRGGLDLADAIRTCRGCGAGDVCVDWLARAPGHVAHAPAFCPNAGRLERLKSV